MASRESFCSGGYPVFAGAIVSDGRGLFVAERPFGEPASDANCFCPAKQISNRFFFFLFLISVLPAIANFLVRSFAEFLLPPCPFGKENAGGLGSQDWRGRCETPPCAKKNLLAKADFLGECLF